MTPAVDRWTVFCLFLVAPRSMWDFSSRTRDWTHDPVQKKHRVLKTGCYCSVAKSCPTLCDPMECYTAGFPVLHYLPEFIQTHDSRVGDALQLSHSLAPFYSCPQSFWEASNMHTQITKSSKMNPLYMAQWQQLTAPGDRFIYSPMCSNWIIPNELQLHTHHIPPIGLLWNKSDMSSYP